MDEIESILAPYADLRLECDGLTRVLDYVLGQRCIKHSVMAGRVAMGQAAIPLHFWIELGDWRLVDYRARMWLGNGADVPHGVFREIDFPKVKYDGRRVTWNTGRELADILKLVGGGLPACQ